MSKYYALVLVPGDTPVQEACDAAAEPLYPYMHDPGEPTRPHEFDYMFSPEDIANLSDDEITDHMWRAGEIRERIPDLQLEAVISPDGTWHATEGGQLWDEEPWVQRVRQVLEQHQDCLALRHVLHT